MDEPDIGTNIEACRHCGYIWKFSDDLNELTGKADLFMAFTQRRFFQRYILSLVYAARKSDLAFVMLELVRADREHDFGFERQANASGRRTELVRSATFRLLRKQERNQHGCRDETARSYQVGLMKFIAHANQSRISALFGREWLGRYQAPRRRGSCCNSPAQALA